jgi:cell division protease FtsH
MSTKLGPIKYEEATGSPFMGRDYGKNKSFSDSVALEIDTEIKMMIEEAQAVAYKVIKSNMKLLELIKTSLLENETIVSEEIEYIAEHLELPPKTEKTQIKSKKFNLEDLIDEVEIESSDDDAKESSSKIKVKSKKLNLEEKSSTDPISETTKEESDNTKEKNLSKKTATTKTKTTTTKLKNTSTTKVKKEVDKTEEIELPKKDK